MRYDRWLDKGIIETIVQALLKGAEMDWIQRDGKSFVSISTRRARRLKRGQTSQCLGRSCGGLGTKRHAVSEGLGLSLRFEAGPGFEHGDL